MHAPETGRNPSQERAKVFANTSLVIQVYILYVRFSSFFSSPEFFSSFSFPELFLLTHLHSYEIFSFSPNFFRIGSFSKLDRLRLGLVTGSDPIRLGFRSGVFLQGPVIERSRPGRERRELPDSCSCTPRVKGIHMRSSPGLPIVGQMPAPQVQRSRRHVGAFHLWNGHLTF